MTAGSRRPTFTPRRPVANAGGGGDDGGMDARVTRLEADMADVKQILGRLEPKVAEIHAFMAATLPTLATKTDLALLRADVNKDLGDLKGELTHVRGEMNRDVGAMKGDVASLRADINKDFGDLKAALAEKPSKTYLWMVMAAFSAAILAAASLG